MVRKIIDINFEQTILIIKLTNNMLQRTKLIWTIAVALCFLFKVDAQTLNLVTGMTFASDRTVFKDNSLSRLPNGFFRLGIGYTSKDNISLSLDYTFDIKQFNLTSTIPIWRIRQKPKIKSV